MLNIPIINLFWLFILATFLPYFFCYDIELEEEHPGTPLFTHSLQPPFTHDAFNNEYFDYGGSTVIKSFDYVRLTADVPSQAGWIYSKSRITAEAWTVQFSFRIHGKSTSLYGDGMAFWFTRDPWRGGEVFGGREDFNGLGIFFDTYPNAEHDHSFPYISAMLNDGTKKYDHDHDNKASMAGHGCEANIRDSEEPYKAKVTYYKNHMLRLELSDGDSWQNCFTISNVQLPLSGYIGFSANTGELHDNHDILGLRTYVNIKKPEYFGKDATDSSKHEDIPFKVDVGHEKGSWFWSFFKTILKLILLGLVVTVGFIGFRAYSKQNNKTF